MTSKNKKVIEVSFNLTFFKSLKKVDIATLPQCYRSTNHQGLYFRYNQDLSGSFYVQKRIKNISKSVVERKVGELSQIDDRTAPTIKNTLEPIVQKAKHFIALMENGEDPAVKVSERAANENVTLPDVLEFKLKTNALSEKTIETYRNSLKRIPEKILKKRIKDLSINDLNTVKKHNVGDVHGQDIFSAAGANAYCFTLKMIGILLRFAKNNYKSGGKKIFKEEELCLDEVTKLYHSLNTNLVTSVENGAIEKKLLKEIYREIQVCKKKPISETSQTISAYFHEFCLFTGMRRGSRNIEWRQISFENKLILFNGVDKLKLKSKRESEIPISNHVCELLKELKNKQEESFGFLPQFVFCKQSGYGEASTQTDENLQKYLETCKLKSNRHISNHSWRYTFTTIADSIGMPRLILKELIGHATNKEQKNREHDVTNRYIDHSDQEKRKELERLTNRIKREVGLVSTSRQRMKLEDFIEEHKHSLDEKTENEIIDFMKYKLSL